MADWSSTEYTFTGDAKKLRELHDSLSQHSRDHLHIGPIIDIEDFQRVTAPPEEPRDFHGAVIAQLDYRETNGIGILSFEEVNDWTDFSVQDHVLAYVGKPMGLRTEFNYGYGGGKSPVNSRTRLIGEPEVHPVDPYFAETIRACGEIAEDSMRFPIPAENANNVLRFGAGSSAMGMMLSGFTRDGDVLASGFRLKPDGRVTVSFTFPRYDGAPMESFSPGEQRMIKNTYFKTPSERVAVAVGAPKRDAAQEWEGPQVKEIRSTPVKIDAEAVQDKVEPIRALMKRLVGRGKLESCGEFRDSLALVRRDGKYNYVREDGTFLAKRWFDSATEFSGGRATVGFGGRTCEIDTGGIVTRVLGQQEDPGKKGGMKI